jgi:hypothetical protein
MAKKVREDLIDLLRLARELLLHGEEVLDSDVDHRTASRVISYMPAAKLKRLRLYGILSMVTTWLYVGCPQLQSEVVPGDVVGGASHQAE